MNKQLLVFLPFLLSACGSDSTESIIPDPITFTPIISTQEELIEQEEISINPPVQTQPAVNIIEPVVSIPLVIEPIEEEPEPTLEPVQEAPVEPAPAVEPPTEIVVVPTPVEPVVELPVKPPIEEIEVEEDTTVIIEYMTYAAIQTLNEINQAYYSASLSDSDLNCINDSRHDPFPSPQTQLDCIVPRATSLGDLSTLQVIADFTCNSSISSSFDSSFCELSSTDQTINAEYDITLIKDEANYLLYIIDMDADLGEDLCIVSINEENISCPNVIYNIASIIRTFGYTKI